MEFRISTPSPTTTPRHPPPIGAESRLGAVVAELRRQGELERRGVQQQLRQMERRMQEQLAAPALGRERWADLQGSMSGLVMEVSALSRRVDGLDERLQLRLSNCEELLRQRTRQLEQQLCAQQHKCLLAAATSEAMSKRQTARLWRLLQSLEEHSTRLSAVEERTNAAVDAKRLEARLAEMEGKQSRIEEELQSLTTDATLRSDTTSGSITQNGIADAVCGADGAALEFDSCSGEEYASTLRSLEGDVSALTKRTLGQLDGHSVALANLRIRTEGQEQRLAAVAERLETVVAPPLSALRAEVVQLREHDRQEAEGRLGELARRVKVVEDTTEEAASELQEQLRDISTELRACELRPEEHPLIRRLGDASAAQGQALRRLEAALAEPRETPALPLEFSSALVRIDALELRLESVERGGEDCTLAGKADRADVLRVDAAVRELTEPVRRLSQRAASSEAASAALERRLEQLLQLQESRSVEEARKSLEGLQAPEALAKVNEMADLTARIVDIEGLLEGAGLGTDSAGAGWLGPLNGHGKSLYAARAALVQARDGRRRGDAEAKG